MFYMGVPATWLLIHMNVVLSVIRLQEFTKYGKIMGIPSGELETLRTLGEYLGDETALCAP